MRPLPAARQTRPYRPRRASGTVRRVTTSRGAADLLREVGLLADGPARWTRPVPGPGPGV